MSALMRDWMRPALCKHLNTALEDNAQDGKASNPYGEHGTFMIHITKGRSIQVNEFISHAPPYLVWVSDSYTQIRAVFTKSSTDTFQKKHKRPFSKGTVGAVLGITDYYLTCNPKAPPSQRVMLRIEGFTLQGSEGSGNFGHPIPMENIRVVKEMLSQLEMNPRNSGLAQSSTLDPMSPVLSQAGVSADDTSSLEDTTQAAFSTQATKKVSNGITVGGHADSASSNRSLLALLELKRTKTQQAPPRDHEPARIYVSPYAQEPSKTLENRGSNSASSASSTSEEHNALPSTSTIPPAEPQAKSRETRERLKDNTLYSQAASGSDSSRNQKVGRPGDGRSNGGMLSNEKSIDSRIENSVGSCEDGNRSLRYKGNILESHRTPDTASRPTRDADRPWEGLTRIPRRYVQIPKDQRTILERDDAWYPQAPGNRQLGVNIPPKVLIDLQAFHDRVGDGVSVEFGDSESVSHSDSDSDGHAGKHDSTHNEHSKNQKDIKNEIQTIINDLAGDPAAAGSRFLCGLQLLEKATWASDAHHRRFWSRLWNQAAIYQIHKSLGPPHGSYNDLRIAYNGPKQELDTKTVKAAYYFDAVQKLWGNDFHRQLKVPWREKVARPFIKELRVIAKRVDLETFVDHIELILRQRLQSEIENGRYNNYLMLKDLKNYREQYEKSWTTKVRITKGSRSVKKAVRKSIHGKISPSSGIVSSGQENAIAQMTSSEAASSDQGDSSFEGSLDATDLESGCGRGVGNTKMSHIQVGEGFLKSSILLDSEGELPIASQDREDGSFTEAMSWPSSPNRDKVCFSRSPSLQREAERSAADDRIDASNLFQSRALPIKVSPVALVDAESLSTEEDESDSGVEPLSILETYAEPAAATRRMIQSSKSVFKSSSVLFSSSPMEMELSVPYALGNQSQPSDDVVMTDSFDAGQTMPSKLEQPHSRFDLESTSSASSHRRSPRPKTYIKTDEKSKLRQLTANVSLDPIIPGTFRKEVSDIFTCPAEPISATRQNGFGIHAFEADQVISATPGHPSRLQSYASSPVGNETYSAQRQIHAESEILTQKGRQVGSGNDIPVSIGIAIKASVVRQQSPGMRNVVSSTSSTDHEPYQLSIPGTQISSSEPPLPPLPRQAPIVDEIILSTLATPIKRRVFELGDMPEHSPKRRRTIQAVIFDSYQEKDPVIDPTEMAKANRRKFLQELSLERRSPGQSPHQLHEESPTRSNTAPKAVAEIFSKDPFAPAPIGAPLDETEPPSVHLKKLPDEGLRDPSLNDSGHSTNKIYEEAADGRRNDNDNIQVDSIGSHQSAIAKDSMLKSAGSREHAQDIIAPTTTGVHSGDNRAQTRTIFDVFNTAYPNYGESQSAFIRACVYLDSLQSMKKAPHPSLWDDFIRAFSAEYSEYIRECKLLRQKPMLAPDFYNDHILEPVFTARIMTIAGLQEASLLDPEETAKARVIIRQKKSQKNREPISAEFYQLMVTSGASAESQDAPATLLEKFSPTQHASNLSTITSRGHSDHSRGVQMISNHVRGVVLAPGCKTLIKKPFFETPSQVVPQVLHSTVGLPWLSMSTPAQEAQSSAVIEDTPKLFESPGIEMVRANVAKQISRRLSWSSPRQEIPEPERLAEVDGSIPGHSNARSRGRNYQQLNHTSSWTPREGSPILGCITINSLSRGKGAVLSGSPPTSLSNLGSRQDLLFKTPNLPDSKSFGRRTTNILGPYEADLEDVRAEHDGEGPYSLRMAKTPNPTISTTTATFKEFSKAFVPRQKRRSSAFGRVSTPGSNDPSPSKINEFKTSGIGPPAEPGTQAWRF